MHTPTDKYQKHLEAMAEYRAFVADNPGTRPTQQQIAAWLQPGLEFLFGGSAKKGAADRGDTAEARRERGMNYLLQEKYMEMLAERERLQAICRHTYVLVRKPSGLNSVKCEKCGKTYVND